MSEFLPRHAVAERAKSPGPSPWPTASRPRQAAPIVLDESTWRERQAAHVTRVRQWTAPHLARSRRREAHVVYDFLWSYYSLRPSLLERWQPGLGLVLSGAGAREFLHHTGYVEIPEGVTLDVAALVSTRADTVRWIASLLRACAGRAPSFGCFGLHEWAMVYRVDEVRYPGTPLRFPSGEIARIVESMPVRCTHYDAFRFFTPAARPMNRVQPESGTRLEFEQRGCVHVTMDLYKWAGKLLPFVPSELLADCFELAISARELDMRASPYDLRGLGFEPVKIETPEGRADYECEQRVLADRAVPLRARLLAVCEQVLS